jgi:hypothetical protein
MEIPTRTEAHVRRKLMKSLVVAVVLLQLGQLFAGPYRVWPFCAYDMFALRSASPHAALVVELTDDAGERALVAPGNVAPLEFFRAAAVVERALVRGSDTALKERVAARLLRQLELAPWSGFDEVWPAARPHPGRHFVRLRVLRVLQIIARTPQGGAALHTHETRVLYDYAPGGGAGAS